MACCLRLGRQEEADLAFGPNAVGRHVVERLLGMAESLFAGFGEAVGDVGIVHRFVVVEGAATGGAVAGSQQAWKLAYLPCPTAPRSSSSPAGKIRTTCLFWAMHPDFGGFARVEALGFRYGQRHAIELEQAQQIADLADVPFTTLDLSGLLSGSALTEHEKDVSASARARP